MDPYERAVLVQESLKVQPSLFSEDACKQSYIYIIFDVVDRITIYQKVIEEQ